DEQEPLPPTTQMLKLNAGQGFTEVGNWTFEGIQNLRAAFADVILVNSAGWYGPVLYDDVAMTADIPEPSVRSSKMLPSSYQSGCDVYQLKPEQEPLLLKHLETCPYNDEGLILTATQAWFTEGFAGISTIDW
ncbi:hypothetical protein, partial [Candidatus Parabeggiatoa sp. HSG14]|uniref:hypothetical protein n=1 Tax=Candidatus Parabeggiatoa sp. HSG14 TaxID=3055593 RepID=UPI0025A6DACB|nr:hypothetical protein [Thiotrichales bacterium HSG14]